MKPRFNIRSFRNQGASLIAISFALGPLADRASAAYASWDWSTGNWTDATRWSSDPNYPNNGQPSPGDTWTVNISSGNVTRNISPTISTLDFSGGTIQGSGVLTVTGAMTWSGGKIEGGDLACNGGLTVSGNARLYGASAEATLASGHTAVISGSGNLSLENQTKITNNGTLYARNDNGISEVGPYQSNFTNTGTFTRDTSSGIFTLGATQVHNSGTYQIQTGTLAITHGITNSGPIQISSGAVLRLDDGSVFNTGSSLSGAGELRINAGQQHIHPALTIPNPVRLDSAAEITVYGGNTLTLNGDFNWNGGKLSREADIFGGAHGFVTLGGNTTIAHGSRMIDLTVTNAAANIATLASGATLGLSDGAVFSNAGTFSLSAGSVLESLSGSGNTLTNSGSLVAGATVFNPAQIGVSLTNSGTVTASAGWLNITGGGSSTGTFQAASGTSINWQGSHTFNAGTTFSGAGRFNLESGTHTFGGSLTTSAEFDVTSQLQIPSGTIFTHNGALNYAGQLSGGGTLTGNATVGLSGGSITGSTLKISSGATATHRFLFTGNTITLNNGGILRNEGDLTAEDAGGFASGTGANNRFENVGTFIRDTNAGTFNVSAALANTGTVQIDIGKLAVPGGGTSSGGTWSVASGATAELSGGFSFSGTNTVSGAGSWVFGTVGGTGGAVTHTLAGTLSLGAPVTLGNATLSLDPAATLTATAPFDAFTGTLAGGGTLHANGGTTIGDLTVSGAALHLGAGSTNIHASTSQLVLASAGTVTNAGTFKARGDFNFTGTEFAIAQGAGAAGSFSNSGTFTRDTGTAYYVVGVPFHNTGTVSSQSGVLGIAAGGTSTGGTWDTTGGLLAFQGDFTFDGTTTITGTTPPQMSDGIYTLNGPLSSTPGLSLVGNANFAIQPAQVAALAGPLEMINNLADIPAVSGGGTVNADGGMSVYAGVIDGATVNLAIAKTASHGGVGSLTLKNGGVLNNAGTYQASGDGFIGEVTAPGNTFHNGGTFSRDISAGVFTVSAPFDNTGTTTASAGTLSFTGTVTSTGTFAPAAGGIIEFTGTSTFDNATPFTDVGVARFTAGTHDFIQSGTITPVVTLAGGTLNVAAATTLDLTGLTHWTGGTVDGGGTLQTTGGLDLSGAATLDASTLAIPAGSEAFQTGDGVLTLNGAAVLSNAGTWHAANAKSIGTGSGTGQTLSNSGTFLRDTDTGTFVVAVPLHNTGTVGVASGILSLQGDGSSSGEFNVIADTDLSLSGSNNFASGSTFTGAGRINLQAGTQTIGDTLPSSAIVNLTGSTLSIQPTKVFQSNGTFHWTAGLVTGGGTLETSGALDLTTSARTLDGTVLSSTALGTISLNALGTLVLTNSGTLENLGTTMLLNDGSITAGDATAVAFNNSGTVTRDTGTGTFTIAVPFNHSGLLNLNSGSLWLNGGGTASNSTTHALAGTNLYVGNNYTFGPANFITGTGATHFSNGSLHVTGSLTTDGSFNWTGGTLDGGGTFTVKGGLNITPASSAVYINGSTLENAPGSESIISGSSSTHILNGGTYRNSGITRLRGNNNFSDGGGGTNRIVNSGTLVRDQGTGSYVITVPIENTGLIQSTAGGLYLNAGGNITAGSLDATGGDIYLNGGSYSFAGGALSGSNWIYLTAGSASVDADTGATTGNATGGFGLSGGSLGGTAMLSVERGYFASGNIGRSPVVRLTGESNKAANTQINMTGGTIRNDGTWTNPAGGNFDLDSSSDSGGGTLDNRGSWLLTGGSTYSNSYGGGQFQNSGLFHASSGGSNILAAVHHKDGGTFRCTGGYVLLGGGGSMEAGATLDSDGTGYLYFNGGTHTLNGGSLTGSNYTYAGAGTVAVAGDVGAAAGPASGGFAISGGTVTGSAMISADHGYMYSGQINGNVTIRLTGATTKEANQQISMNGGTIRNEGNWTNRSSGNFDLDNGSGGDAGTLENRGTWTLEASATYSNSYGGGQLVNYGTFQSTTGNSNILGAIHHKAGSVFRSAGSSGGYILMNGGGTMEAGATLDANGNRYMYFYGGTHTLYGGTLTGSGHTYTGNTATVVVAGDVGATSGAATGGFGMIGGTLAGSAMISADHGYMYSGQINGDVTIRFTGATTKEANQQISMNGGTIRNEGNWTNLSSGNFDLDNGSGAGSGTLENRGTWTLEASATYSNSYGGGQLVNYGTFQSTSGNSNILGAIHHKAGSVFRSAGSSGGYILMNGGGTMEAGATLDADGNRYMYFYGGTHTLYGGTLTGSGHTYTGNTATVVVAGDVGATSGSATGGFGMIGGTLAGSAMISADHGYMQSGQIDGTATIRLTGASTKAANTHLAMSGGTIRNEGTWSNLSNGTFDLDNSSGAGGGMLENHGIWTLEAGTTYHNSYGGGQLVNFGMFQSTAGASNILAATHHKDGSTFRVTSGYVLLGGGGTMEAGATLDADASGSIYFNGGTHTLAGGTLTGSQYIYANQGTANITGDVGATSGAATGGFAISGGTVTGSAMISADHGWFSSGQVAGTTTIRLTGASTKAANTHLAMSGGTIRNEGTWSSLSNGTFDLDNNSGTGGGMLENRGTWTLQAGTTYHNSYGGGQLVNFGMFQSTAGASNILAATHHKDGSTFRVTSGYVLLGGGGTMEAGATLDADASGSIYFNGGTHTLAGGTLTGSQYTYANQGTTNITGDVGATSGAATGGFGISGGTVTGSAMISADHGWFSSGQISGTATIRLTGASTKAANTQLGFSGGTLRNDGILTQESGGTLDLDNSSDTGGGTLLNNGIWNIIGGVTLSNSHGQGTVDNTGGLMVSAGGSAFHVPLSNSGSITVDGGYLYLYQGSSHGGAIIANGGIGFISGTHTMSGPTAYLGGTGYSTGTLALSNGASIRPGNSAGNLTNYGTLTFSPGGASPSVVVDLESASSFDSITLGNGSLLSIGTGLTDLVVQPSYQPVAGTVFRIVTATPGSGAFTGRFRNAPVSGSVVTGTLGANAVHFRVTYDASGKFVDLTALTPYQGWAEGKGLAGADAGFTADPDMDGIPNGVEFVIGGEPNPSNPGSNSSSLMPQVTVDATHLRFVFRRSAASAYLSPTVEHDADLTGPWTRANDGENGVTVTITPDGFSSGIDRVEVLIPRTLEVAGKLFARLNVVDP